MLRLSLQLEPIFSRLRRFLGSGKALWYCDGQCGQQENASRDAHRSVSVVHRESDAGVIRTTWFQGPISGGGGASEVRDMLSRPLTILFSLAVFAALVPDGGRASDED